MANVDIIVGTASCAGGRPIESLTTSSRALRKDHDCAAGLRVVFEFPYHGKDLGRAGKGSFDLVGSGTACTDGSVFLYALASTG